MNTAYPLHLNAGKGISVEVALLFAMAAFSVNASHAASLSSASLTGEPAITAAPLKLARSQASRVLPPPSNAIVVRRSTKLTEPPLDPIAAFASFVTRSLAPAAAPTVGLALAVRPSSVRPSSVRPVTVRRDVAHLSAVSPQALLSLAALRCEAEPWLATGPMEIDRGGMRHRAGRIALEPTLLALRDDATPENNVKMIRVARMMDVGMAPPLVAPSLPTMAKVISVAALKLPPSGPLPSWNADRIVPLDNGRELPGGARLAQNPDSAPLRHPTAPITNSDRLPNQLEVSVGTFVVLLTTTDLNTVAVADPNTADVAVVSSRAVLVNGKTPGVTSLVIVDGTRIRQYQVRVTPAIGTRSPDVAAAIGIPGVSVRPLRDALVLEGEVDNQEEVRRAVEIAGIFSNKIVNQLTVHGAPTSDAAMATQIQSAINIPTITVRSIGDNILLEGRVDDASQRQRADTIANHLSKNVLDLIELPRLTVEQVRDSLGANPLPPGPPSAPAVTSPLPPPNGGSPPPVSSTSLSGLNGPMDGITVRQVGDQIILQGMVPLQSTIDQAAVIAARSGLLVVNQLQLMPTIPASIAYLNSVDTAIGIPGVHASGTAKRVVLTGLVADTNVAVQAEQIARSYGAEVDNMLQTSHPIAVNVDVSILEVNKNDLSNLGASWSNFLDTTGFILSERTATGTPGNTGDNAGPNAANPFQWVTRSPLQVALHAIVNNGGARLLSHPRTTVLSGRTATFQVGGQVPISSTTVTASGSTTSIVFKDFGILIDIVPVGSVNGVVTMRVRAEVSQPDFAIGVTPAGGGSAVPGFSRRSAVTEVTVPAGGSIALAGMIQNNAQKLVSKMPILSSIPIIGALFTSKRFQHDQTELAIFVTPTVLPNPLKPGETAPAAPFVGGNSTNVATRLGNPGLSSFDVGGTPAGG